MDNTALLVSFLKIIIAIPIVILLAYISLRMGNKLLAKGYDGKNIKIIERINLSNKAALYIAKISDEYFLLGVSDQNITLLKELTDIKELKNIEKNPISFEHTLLKNLNRMRKKSE